MANLVNPPLKLTIIFEWYMASLQDTNIHPNDMCSSDKRHNPLCHNTTHRVWHLDNGLILMPVQCAGVIFSFLFFSVPVRLGSEYRHPSRFKSEQKLGGPTELF